MKRDSDRTDCFWIHDIYEQGFAGYVCSNNSVKSHPYDCPCRPDCPRFLSNKEVSQIIKDYLDNRPRTCRRVSVFGEEPKKTELGYCPHCEIELAPYAMFCHRCGSRIENPGLPGVTNG